MTSPIGFLVDSLGQPTKNTVLTPQQVAAGATGVVAVTPGGMVDGAGNTPVGGLSAAQASALQTLVAGSTQDASSRNITAADSGKLLAPTTSLTYTIPVGLSPMPSFTVDCPAAGTISIAVSGGATANGATATLTRIRSANPVGFVVVAHSETDAYGVSGS